MTQPPEPLYAVVIDPADQYSVWPAGRPLPPGWRDAGTRGTRDACVAHVRREHADSPYVHPHGTAARWSAAAT